MDSEFRLTPNRSPPNRWRGFGGGKQSRIRLAWVGFLFSQSRDSGSTSPPNGRRNVFESAKTAVDGLKSVLSLQTLKVRNELQGRIGEVESAFAEARETVHTLQVERTASTARIEELEREVAQLKNWDAEKERYEHHETDFGSLVYALKDGVQSVGPKHYLCEPCFNANKKSVLQPTGGTIYSSRHHAHYHESNCPLCAAKFGFDRSTPRPLPKVRRSEYF